MKSKTVYIDQVPVGGEHFTVIAGPCAIESYERLETIALKVQSCGAKILRGGVFKMRTSPDAFQGLGHTALEYVQEVKKKTGMPFAVEITDASQIALFYDKVDAFQVGTRNMHNTFLLSELGKQNKPVILKRGMSAYLKEWLNAAEYIVKGGNEQIILCERGIRSFDNETRNLLDIAGAVWAKQRSSFPVIMDPSHGTGMPDLIPPMCNAAVASGLDGVMIEVHPNPEEALSDGFQALTFEVYEKAMSQIAKIAAASERIL